jgi:hypothetical protein
VEAPDFVKGDKEGWLWMWGQEEVVEVRERRSHWLKERLEERTESRPGNMQSI